MRQSSQWLSWTGEAVQSLLLDFRSFVPVEAQEATNPNAMRAANAVSAWSIPKQKSVPAGAVNLAVSPRTLLSEWKGSGSHESPAKGSRVSQGEKIGERAVDRGESKPNQLPFQGP